MGHPGPIRAHHGLHRLDEVVLGDLGDAQAAAGGVEPLGVFIGPEEDRKSVV